MSRPGRRSQRGAIIIHVAFALMALLVFTSFVIDYGVMWVSRRQAQNVVDSAALAGALAFIYGGDPTQAAQHFAANNAIWSEGNSALNVDVAFSGAATPIPPCGVNEGCIRVDVFRNTLDRALAPRGNDIPTYFARLVGLDAQGVRATATAETASGNLVSCLLPFAVADRWADGTDLNIDTTTFQNDDDHIQYGDPIRGWSPNDLYEDAAAGGIDFYQTPTATDPGTGWTVDGDFGRMLILKDGEVGQFSAGWANKVDLPGSVGASDYRDDIKACNETPVGIAQEGQDCTGFPNSGTTVAEAAVGCLGVSSGLTVGPTAQGIDRGGPPGPNGEPSVLLQDPGAYWSETVPNPARPSGFGGVAKRVGGVEVLNMDSPRIRPIAIFDIAHYMNNPACVNQAGTGCVIRVANIVGFFIEGMCPDVTLDPGMQCAPNPEGRNQVVGRIVTNPAATFNGAGELDDEAAFLQIVRLVR